MTSKFAHALSVTFMLTSAMMMTRVSADSDLLPASIITWPYQERAATLEQVVVTKDADMIGVRADLSTCYARLDAALREVDSTKLTNDVVETIKKLEAQHPGAKYTWDNDKRRIVPVLTVKEPEK